MRHLSGQALRRLHRLLHWAEFLLVLAALGLGAAAWRLSRGPWEVPGLAGQIAAALASALPPGRHLSVRIGSAALTWEGFRRNGAPLDIRLADLAVTDAAGGRIARIPLTRVSLALGRLLAGEIAPESIVLVRPRIAARRAADGAVSFDLSGDGEARRGAEAGPAQAEATPLAALARLLARLTGPEHRAAGVLVLRDLRDLAITDAVLTVEDRPLGAVWRVPAATVQLHRAAGRLTGAASLGLALPHATAHLFASLTFDRAGGTVRLTLDPTSPAGLAGVAAALAPLAALAAPVSARLALRLTPALAARRLRLAAKLGAGALEIGGGAVPLASGALAITGDGDRLAITGADLMLAAPAGQAAPSFQASGTLETTKGWRLALHLAARGIDFATLGRFWPAGLFHDPRAWVVHNITAGSAHGAALDLVLASGLGFARPRLVSLAGGVTGAGLSVRWLPRLPPLTGGTARLMLDGIDRFTATVTGARQGPLAVGPGTVVVSGLSAPDQLAEITTTVSGPLAAAFALLAEPALHLLQRAPIPLRGAAGEVRATLHVRVPLFARLKLAQVGISARATLTRVHLTRVLAGRDLDQASLALAADTSGLTLSGSGAFGGVPVRLHATMDFRAHPPGGVAAKLHLASDADAAALARAGIPLGGMVAGPVGLQVDLAERPGGEGDIALAADLGAARLAFAPLAWTKPAGVPARLTARVAFAAGRARSIEGIDLAGPGLAVRGRAELPAAGGVDLSFSRLLLGGTDASGTLALPGGSGPIRANFSGPVLDLAARMATRPKRPAAAKAPAPPGPPWRASLRFARILLGKPLPDGTARALDGAVIGAASDGRRLTSLSLIATPVGGKPLSVSIAPGPGGRVLAAATDDAGALFRAADLMDTLIGGTLRLSARYADGQAGDPLAGTLEIDTFRVGRAPVLGKLLQAMTLYGLADALGGPGLAFHRLVVPFRLAGGILALGPARAFSPSLGVTARGTIDRAAGRVALTGTIVPAYFFNSLLGNLPIVGRLFSPEKGSGLFAANYQVNGPIANPSVSVNPLSALTPGFLRGVFGLFGQPKPAK